MQHYPKYLYRAGESVLVQNKEDHDALDGKWYESPAEVPVKSDAEIEREALFEEAEALGLKLDGRMGTDKVKAAIEAAKKK